MRALFIFIYNLSLSLSVLGQYGIESYGGVRGLSMGNIGSVLRSVEGQYVNPASLAFVNQFEANIDSERRFESISLYQLGLSVGYSISPTSAIGAHIQRVSIETFSNTKVGASYAHKLSENFSIGAQFTFQQISIDLHGSKSAANATIGVQGRLTDDLYLGASVINPIPTTIIFDEELPMIFLFGARLDLSELITVMVEFEKDVDFPVNVKAGFEYSPLPAFAIRVGINTDPASYHFGVGLNLSKLAWINLGTSYDQNLGFSPALGITLR